MKKAFTLIELLVAVAIISILLAFAFPAFLKSRERARRTLCISNLRQLHIAIGAYCDDNDSRYPWAWMNDSVNYNPVKRTPSLKTLIAPYVANDAVCGCPSDTGETWPLMPGGWERRTPPQYSMPAGTSYYWLGRGLDDVLPGKAVESVRHPDRVIELFEPRPWHGSPKPDDNYDSTKDLFNVLYCDGHVKPQPYSQIRQDRMDSLPW